MVEVTMAEEDRNPDEDASAETLYGNGGGPIELELRFLDDEERFELEAAVDECGVFNRAQMIR